MPPAVTTHQRMILDRKKGLLDYQFGLIVDAIQNLFALADVA
jgi:hypothetical protein